MEKMVEVERVAQDELRRDLRWLWTCRRLTSGPCGSTSRAQCGSSPSTRPATSSSDDDQVRKQMKSLI